MRAKFRVTSVKPYANEKAETQYETLEFMAVSEAPFNKDGDSEDSSFAKWTPTGTLQMSVTNPALFGKFKPGQKFYLDFTEAK